MKKFQPKTRGGYVYKLRERGYDSKFPLQGQVMDSNGTWAWCTWTEEGSYTEVGVDAWDLIPVEELDAIQPPSYDLTKVSERFRAMEDGHSLIRHASDQDHTYTPEMLSNPANSKDLMWGSLGWTLILKPTPKVKHKRTMWGCEAELRSLLAEDRKYITLTNEAADAGRAACTPVEVEWFEEEQT